MKKILYSFTMILILMISSLTAGFSLQTYVGIKIEELKDDPNASCVGAYNSTVDPNNQGRIRAISSIVGSEYPQEYPIYFELTNRDTSTLVWSGNTTDDTDYKKGDTIYIPETVNLTSGNEYKLFFDVDAYKIYLPLENNGEFESKPDDIYWTTGDTGLIDYNDPEHYQESSDCLSTTTNYGTYDDVFAVSNDRSKSLDNGGNCLKDEDENNCPSHFAFIRYDNGNDFNISGQYNDLYQDTVGNFELIFTQP